MRLLIPVGLIAAVCSAEPQSTFTYTLTMSDVDAVEGATMYEMTGAGRPAIIGFGKSWTATKRLPFRFGPGRVRAYVYQLNEKPERTFTVTLGGRSQSVAVGEDRARYHRSELLFDLTEATDQAEFAVEVNGDKGRTIWYTTTFTNDPNWKYVELPKDRGKERWGLVYSKPVPESAPGNLLPNSGFEEGVLGWDMQPYRSNVMAKPSLLNRRAAHGSYSLDVGKILIISRRFVLAGQRTYTLSLHVAADNPAPVVGRVEAETSKGDFVKLLDFGTTEAAPSGVDGWERASFVFKSLPDAETRDGHYRVVLDAKRKPEEPIGEPVLVDSLQILEGDHADGGDYVPHGGLEANFVSPITQAIFEVGEPTQIELNLHKAPEAKVGRCTHAVYDYFDRQVQPPRRLQIEGNTFRRAVPFDTSRAGFFRVRTTIDYGYTGEDRTKSVDFSYNVVRPTPPRTDRREKSLLGAYYVHPPIEPYGYAEVARKFGFHEFNTLGNALMRWTTNIARDATPDNVTYDWTTADEHVEAFTRAGISIVAQLHVAHSSYAVPEPCKYEGDNRDERFVFDGTRQKGDEKFSRALWLDYVKQFARRYKGKFSKYVIQDEPEYYFSPDEYARFFLATREAIQAVDPSAPVFFDAFLVKDMKFLDALNRATDGKAHEHLDGVHAYLDGKQCNPVSRKAALDFRAWLHKHDVPLVTVTCYSTAHRLDTAPADRQEPLYLAQRVAEARSVQYLLDGVIWGGSNCFYYYYGAHTGKERGTYLFDEFGRVKPVFHFYSAANHLLGGHLGTESIDGFDFMRIGLVTTGENRGVGVLYSLDGRIHDFDLPAAGIAEVLDGLGNPVADWKHDDRVEHYVSRHPVYLIAEDLAAARNSLRSIRFQEKLPVRFGYSVHPTGVLQVKAILRSGEPLEATTEIAEVFNPESPPTRVAAAKLGDDEYALDLALLEPPWRTLTRKVPLIVATNFGDLSAELRPLYAAITRADPIGATDGRLDEGEWPPERTGRVPLTQWTTDPATGEAVGRRRGSACLKLEGGRLRGLVALPATGSSVRKQVRFELVPLDPTDLKPRLLQRMTLTLEDDGEHVSGTITPGGVAPEVVPSAREVGRAGPWYELSVPVAQLPHFSPAVGRAYAFNVTAVDVADPTRLTASWRRYEDDAVERWGQLMIVD